MDICFITDHPGTTWHPVISSVLQQLSTKHSVRLLDVLTLTAEEAIARVRALSPADIYLLKSHLPQALALAQALEKRGAQVVNGWGPSRACQDRVLMSQRMTEAGLPWPLTWTLDPSANGSKLARLPFPLMVKSRYSRRGDLVQKVDDVEELRKLLQGHPQASLVLQEFVPGNSSVIKVWVIGDQLFAASRPEDDQPDARPEDCPIPGGKRPESWRAIALKVGRVFGLHLYGVDLLHSEQGPVPIDVNSFPGFRGVPGADFALAAFIERLATGAANAHP